MFPEGVTHVLETRKTSVSADGRSMDATRGDSPDMETVAGRFLAAAGGESHTEAASARVAGRGAS